MIISRTSKMYRIAMLVTLAALLSSLKLVGFRLFALTGTMVRSAKEVLDVRTNIIALAFLGIVVMAMLRCWFFARLARQETPRPSSSRSNNLAPITPV